MCCSSQVLKIQDRREFPFSLEEFEEFEMFYYSPLVIVTFRRA